jgi:hypothetical protein
MLIYDPTAYVMHFFAIAPPREAKKLQAVRDFLNLAATQFAAAVGKGQPHQILQLEDFNEGASDRLTFVEPSPTDSGLQLELVVRTLHDTAMLRTRAMHEGTFELDNLAALDFSVPLPQPAKEIPNNLGVFRVWYVETDQQESHKRAGVGQAVATALQWSWLTDAEPISTPLGTLLFGVPPRLPHQQHETPTLDLLFVGGRNAAEIAQGYPVHPFLLTLPELALCHLKVRNSAGNINYHWLGLLADRDRELRDLLPKEGEDPRNLQQMLDLNDELTARQARLVDTLAHVQLELRTMRINRDNFAAAAQAFKRVAVKLQHLLINRWLRTTELQAENDIGYTAGTLQRAENHFKSIEASAAAHQARELDKINRSQIALAIANVLLAVVAGLTGIVSAYLAWKALPVH